MNSFLQEKIESKEIKIRNCVFGFGCDANWDAMKETNQDDVRFCNHCEKEVHFIATKSSLLESVNLNRCVAISSLIRSDDEMKMITLGEITNYIEEN